MPGRIADADIAAVREAVRIDDVIRDYVTLRPSGSGSLKGLCPFHDEKSPSFNVRPQVGYWHCFGCGKGGDAIDFLIESEQLTFVDAVERLAQRAGIQLTYTEGGPRAGSGDAGRRQRLVSVNAAAAEFYAAQLHQSDAAQAGRAFLHERGFDADAARTFGVGFAPRDGEGLLKHLRGRGFSDDDQVTAGLIGQSNRGPYDRFRGRLLWPIRDASGDVVAFGARRLFDDDRIEAKYLNTPETQLFKKSQVLYGVDLARRDIARMRQAVVVEGYTDVMACHLSGVPTAVATCGTAFGEGHSRLLRRLLLDDQQRTGEIIFTFDGDEAGQKAALRAFQDDQQFVAQTYVAVEPSGADPCELRQRDGAAAVRELVARRVPLYRFALTSVIARYDLDRADGRIDALRATAPLVASVRDSGKVSEYIRELSHMITLDPEQVRAEVSRAASRGNRGRPSDRDRPVGDLANGSSAAAPQAPDPAANLPDAHDPSRQVEREVLKLAVQRPALVGPGFDAVAEDDFTHPAYRAMRQAIASAGGTGTAAGGEAWLQQLSAALPTDQMRGLLSSLAVEDLLTQTEPDARYGAAFVARVREIAVGRVVTDLKGRLQRMNPVTQTEEYNRLFGQLITAEKQHRQLREAAAGGLA